MKFFLKKYLPIFSYKNNVQIGLPVEEFVEVDYDDKTRQALQHLLTNGITKSELRNDLFYSQLESKNLLCPEHELTSSRKELFFDYLKLDYKSINLKKKILILGAGGAGSTMAYLLAQFGFSNLAILDYDIVEYSDVEKTMVYKKNEIGRKKIDALSDSLTANFDITPETFDKEIKDKSELWDLIEKLNPDLVIKSWDPDMIFRNYLNDICYNKKIPFVYLAYSYVSVRLGPFFVPGITACDMCLLKHLSKTYSANREDYTKYKRIHKEYSIHPTTSFNLNIMANIILKDIVFYYLNKMDYVTTLGTTLEYIPLTFMGVRYVYPKDPECSYCGRVNTGTAN